MKIKEKFDIDEGILEELAEVSDFWEKSFRLFIQTKDEPVDQVKDSILDWLHDITMRHRVVWSRLQ